MNSEILVLSSSGEGNGGGGFCSIARDPDGRAKIYHPRDGCKSDSQSQNSFILGQMQPEANNRWEMGPLEGGSTISEDCHPEPAQAAKDPAYSDGVTLASR
jgi:hypothetical protein